MVGPPQYPPPCVESSASPPGVPPTLRRQSHSSSGKSIGAVCAAATQLACRHCEGRRDQAAS
eukprot:scaffold80294_cov59-Phaeocystis_antarctica.AAC.3